MKIHTDLDSLKHIPNLVLTIGSFDGVHKGHQHIIKRLIKAAKDVQGETVLLTFDPHPRIVLAQQRGETPTIQLLTTLEEKATLLQQYGINHLAVIPFTKVFSSWSPERYIKEFLMAYFHPKCIVIGYDHRFGKDRTGDIEYLRQLESSCGYQVLEIPKHEINDITVSSTKVRIAITKGDVQLAAQLMGHPYQLSGVVVKGLKIGRTIEFPTANLKINSPYKLIPPSGVYAVLVEYKLINYKAMLYIGNRPTVDEDLTQTIEVNIFDFNQNIYNEQLKIDFIKFLRTDTKFKSLEDLQTQLKKDEKAAKAALMSIEI